MAGNEIVKLDLHGSVQQMGITSLRHDYAVRRCIVRGLPNTNDDLGSAILKCFQDPEGGLFHQNLYQLPLTKIRAVKWGPYKAKVQMIYSRGRFGAPPIRAIDTASTYKAYEFIPVYRLPFKRDTPGTPEYTNGIPDGDWSNFDPTPSNQDPGRPPISYRHRIPVVRVVYKTVLSYNPFAQTEQFLNKINDSGVKMGAVTFSPFTLRFDGVNAEASQIFKGSGFGTLPNPGPTFDVQYEFTANPDGHYRQFAYWDDMGAGEWTTTIQKGYETENFNPNNFPAHG